MLFFSRFSWTPLSRLKTTRREKERDRAERRPGSNEKRVYRRKDTVRTSPVVVALVPARRAPRPRRCTRRRPEWNATRVKTKEDEDEDEEEEDEEEDDLPLCFCPPPPSRGEF